MAGAEDTDEPSEAAELRAELERLQREHIQEQHARALAEAEAWHLKARLAERAEHIADLQRALATFAPASDALDRVVIPQPTAPVSRLPAPAAPEMAPPARAMVMSKLSGDAGGPTAADPHAQRRARPAPAYLLGHLLHELLRLPLRHLLREPSGPPRIAAGHRVV